MHRLQRCAWIAVLTALRFHRPPATRSSAERDAAFQDLYASASASAPGSLIDYQLPYPKHEFLSYLVERERVLLHGSSHPDLGRLEPRSQDTWQGEKATGVFAASDGIWPLFFAILRSDGEPRSLRNACVSVPTRSGTRRHYFFGVDEATMRREPWADGFVYIVPRETFARVTPHRLFREEWISAEPVRPLARLPVSPDDFPFLDSVVAFPRDEAPARTWLRLAPPPLGGRSATRR